VIHRILRITAFVCCALVVASFALFMHDELSGASNHQVRELATSAAATAPVTTVTSHHGQPRAFIDGAAGTLTSPFKSIVQSDSQWVQHGVPLVFALLVYGAGLGYLARYTRGLS
jgi:hypothetical protein